ncbi:MAG: archaeosortase C [Halobacteriota archaeon]|nr:archaeosortase C [Halobacteriota archaeon]
MMSDAKNLTIFLLILALFLGATVEITEGSVLVGVLLFAIAIILISRVRFGKSYSVDRSRVRMFLGIAIIAADAIYNIYSGNQLGTVDIMTFLLGLSLIAYDLKSEDARRMGKFGAYMSATFLVLYIIFYDFFGIFETDVIHLFDHYFVLIPSITLVKALGIPVEVIATETVYVGGIEDMSVIIGGPCSGLYSMFLLVGIMVAYTRIEPIEQRIFYSMLMISVVVSYVANLLRVTTLYVVAYNYGSEAMFTVHTHLGWIIFAVIVTAILYVLDRMSLVRTPDQS